MLKQSQKGSGGMLGLTAQRPNKFLFFSNLFPTE